MEKSSFYEFLIDSKMMKRSWIWNWIHFLERFFLSQFHETKWKRKQLSGFLLTFYGMKWKVEQISFYIFLSLPILKNEVKTEQKYIFNRIDRNWNKVEKETELKLSDFWRLF